MLSGANPIKPTCGTERKMITYINLLFRKRKVKKLFKKLLKSVVKKI